MQDGGSRFSGLSKEELVRALQSNVEVIAAQEREINRLREGWNRANDRTSDLENRIRKYSEARHAVGGLLDMEA